MRSALNLTSPTTITEGMLDYIGANARFRHFSAALLW